MDLNCNTFEARLAEVRASIERFCREAGRSASSVKLLPVTKNHPVEAARLAFEAGVRAVGENRVQEAAGKFQEVDAAMVWELIGPLQTNKVKKAVAVFSRVQTVDRPKLVRALQRNCEDDGKTLRVLLQVNAGRDPNKSGVSVEDAAELAELALESSNLRLEGLMTIAPLDDDPAVARRCFADLRACRDDLQSRFKVSLPELSMGMSGDLGEAILEGSTMVRVGTALFGAR